MGLPNSYEHIKKLKINLDKKITIITFLFNEVKMKFRIRNGQVSTVTIPSLQYRVAAVGS
ncbi:MAG: hypothetical protein LBU83_03875 [Bacteroidales bacterium]|nr:hypothetical protein [Bacteroidales bacterium]